jgi:hypothetical protein
MALRFIRRSAASYLLLRQKRSRCHSITPLAATLMRPDLAGLEKPAPRSWHCQQHTSSDRTPLARMLPRVIGGPACDRGRVLMPGRIKSLRAGPQERCASICEGDAPVVAVQNNAAQRYGGSLIAVWHYKRRASAIIHDADLDDSVTDQLLVDDRLIHD